MPGWEFALLVVGGVVAACWLLGAVLVVRGILRARRIRRFIATHN